MGVSRLEKRLYPDPVCEKSRPVCHPVIRYYSISRLRFRLVFISRLHNTLISIFRLPLSLGPHFPESRVPFRGPIPIP